MSHRASVIAALGVCAGSLGFVAYGCSSDDDGGAPAAAPDVRPPALPVTTASELYPGPKAGTTYVTPASATQGGADVTPALSAATPIDLAAPVVIDFGTEVGGFVEITGAGDVVVKFSETKELMPDGDSTAPFEVQANPTVAAKADWTATPYLRGGFRWVSLSKAGDAPASVSGVRVRYTPRVLDIAKVPGSFLSTDPILNRSYYVGLHTLALCTVKSTEGLANGTTKLSDAPWLVVDGAKRDRAVWNGDLIVAARVTEATLGRDQTITDSLLANAQSPRGDGYIWAASNVPQMNAGLPVPQLFSEYTGWWVQTWAHQTITYRDKAFGSANWDIAQQAMAYLATLTNARGLVEVNVLNGANWSYSIAREPFNAYNDLWLLATRRAFREAAAFLGQDPGADVTEAQAAAIRAAYWDEGKGVFIDSPGDVHVSEDTNSMALILGLVNADEARRVTSYLAAKHWTPQGSANVDVKYDASRMPIATQAHNKKVWPFANYFEVLGRLRWGDGAGALDLMKRTWGTMLDAGPGTTFWEGKVDPGESDPTLSMAHSWSAGITSLLGIDAVGYRVEADGAVVLRPTNLQIERYKTRVPGVTPVTADVTYTKEYQRLEVSEGAALVVEVTDFAAQRVWLDGAELKRDDGRVKVVDGRRRISLTSPFRLEFVPTPQL